MNYFKMKKAAKDGNQSVQNYMSHIEAFARTNQQLNPPSDLASQNRNRNPVSGAFSTSAHLTNEPDMTSIKSFHSGKENFEKQLYRERVGSNLRQERRNGDKMLAGGMPPKMVSKQRLTTILSGASFVKTDTTGGAGTLDGKFGKTTLKSSRNIDDNDTVSVQTENTQLTSHRHAMRDFSTYYNSFRKRSNSFCK